MSTRIASGVLGVLKETGGKILTAHDYEVILKISEQEGFAAMALTKLALLETLDGGNGTLTALVPDEEILSFVSALGEDEDYGGVIDEWDNQPPGYFPPHDPLAALSLKR